MYHIPAIGIQSLDRIRFGVLVLVRAWPADRASRPQRITAEESSVDGIVEPGRREEQALSSVPGEDLMPGLALVAEDAGPGA